MNAVRNCVRLGRASARNFGTNKVLRNEAEKTETFKELKRQQELFQRDDGVDEVYRKGGVKDVALFNFTAFFTVISFAWAWYDIFEFVKH